jgi:hypothetical protein
MKFFLIAIHQTSVIQLQAESYVCKVLFVGFIISCVSLYPLHVFILLARKILVRPAKTFHKSCFQFHIAPLDPSLKVGISGEQSGQGFE